jgi:hypothetical protein
MTVSIGQKLWMQSGDERIKVKVIEVTEKRIVVEFVAEARTDEGEFAFRPSWSGRGSGRYFPVFDKDGKQPEGDDPAFNIVMYAADIYRIPRPLRGKNGEPFHLVGV